MMGRAREVALKFWGDRANRISLLLAVSLVLFICHYQVAVLEYVPLFQIGGFLIVFVTGYALLNDWHETKRIGLGPKYIWIPLAVISGSAVARVFIQHDPQTFGGALFMASMFGLYVMSRRYGERALNMFVPVVIIGAVSVIVGGIVSPNYQGNAGLFNNYATASEFLVFGWVVSPRRYQWWLSAIVVAALFFSAAPESVFYVAAIGVVVLIRHDWGRRILLPLGILGLCFLVCTPLGITQDLWGRSLSMLHTTYVATSDTSLTVEQRDQMLNRATDDRWLGTWGLDRPVSPLGHGLDITNSVVTTNPGFHVPHFIALLVTDQLGPVAAAAWLFVIVAGFIKSQKKYAYLALGLFGVFQPFVWTEMAPYMWVTAGATRGTSYVFREA